MIVCNDSKDISLLQDKIADNARELNRLAKTIQTDLWRLHRHTIDQENKLHKQNPYIVKSVIKYLANGIDKENALLLTAADYDTDIKRVRYIFNQQSRYMTAINLFAKRYTCEKLKKAGYTAKQIAMVIGVSENHIFKLLRANVDFWFLK